MLLRLSKNAFVRQYGDFTYVLERVKCYDQVFKDAEVFMRWITRVMLVTGRVSTLANRKPTATASSATSRKMISICRRKSNRPVRAGCFSGWSATDLAARTR